MIEEMKEILHTFERFYVSYVYCEGNAVVDWMANEAVSRDTSHGWQSGEEIMAAAKKLIEIEII